MTVKRDPDAILAAWLEEGPTRLPDTTRRSIAVTTRTTRQARRPTWLPWRFSTMNGMSRLALGAVAVVAVVIGGIFVLRPATESSGVGESRIAGALGVTGLGVTCALGVTRRPSAAASPDSSIPAMTEPYTSAKFGYSLRHPAGWIGGPRTGTDRRLTGRSIFAPAAAGGTFRALSVAVPDGSGGR